MIHIHFVAHDGVLRTVEIAAGTSLMEAAKANDIPGIEAACGGNCYCGTCRVHVAPEWLDRLAQPESFETEMIAATSAPGANDRLSCQIPLSDALDGLVVHTPEQQF